MVADAAMDMDENLQASSSCYVSTSLGGDSDSAICNADKSPSHVDGPSNPVQASKTIGLAALV